MEEPIIIFATEEMEKKFKDEKIENYFIDITYKIVPKIIKNINFLLLHVMIIIINQLILLL